MYRWLTLCLACVALLAFVTGTALSQVTPGNQGNTGTTNDRTATGSDRDTGNTHEGTIVSVDPSSNKLVMKGKDTTGGTATGTAGSGGTAGTADQGEHTHTLAPGCRILCDGKECTLADLKPNMRVRVTTKRGDPTTVVRVEALDKNTDFGGR